MRVNVVYFRQKVRSKKKPSKWLAYLWWGVSAAALTTGIVFGKRSVDSLDAMREDKGMWDTSDPRFDDSLRDSIIADICFGAAALSGIIGLVRFLRDPTPESTGKIVSGIAPSVGKQSVSIAAQGSF